MASEEDLKSYYQVPSKPLAEFNITNDKVYTLTLNENDTDTNFGNLAKLSAVPIATTSTVGGFKLYVEDDGTGTATVNSLNKQYGVQIRDSDKIGFVYVPWLNTLYQAAPTGYLCAECISEANGHDGGLFLFDISCVPVTLISGAGDMLSGDGSKHDHSIYENVSVDISEPLQANIDAAIREAAENLRLHNIENNNDFNDVHLSIKYLSDDLGTDFYRKNLTSNDVELNSQFVGLSNDFEKYLRNELWPGTRSNPSWLIEETSSATELGNMFNSLSTAVDTDYMHKVEAYFKTETSSKVELQDMFDTKLNNLSVHTLIDRNPDNPYTDKDIATVTAISNYIKEQLDEHTALFQGHFASLTAVPTDGNSTQYISPVPDFNDYIFVNITESDLKVDGFNFAAKDIGVWRMKIAARQWDPAKGRQNWQPEYKISDSAFTPTLIAAINSGINSNLVSLIMSYAAIRNRLVSEFPNMTTLFGLLALLDRIVDNITGIGKAGQIALFNGVNSLTSMPFTPNKEKWRFELQDGTTYVERYILTENV